MNITRVTNAAPEFKAKLKADIVALLKDSYELTKDVKNPNPKKGGFYVKEGTGVFVKGNAVSYIKDYLTRGGYRGFGNLSDFESILRELGFSLAPGKNGRGNNATVIFLKD